MNFGGDLDIKDDDIESFPCPLDSEVALFNVHNVEGSSSFNLHGDSISDKDNTVAFEVDIGPFRRQSGKIVWEMFPDSRLNSGEIKAGMFHSLNSIIYYDSY